MTGLLDRVKCPLLTEGDSITLFAAGPARLIVIGEKPHREEIILRGSFVY